jgi:hypothetical protein
MIDLRALTLTAPMGQAIVTAHPRAKRIENRPRPLPKHMLGHETVIAVHAGVKWDAVYAQVVWQMLGHNLCYQDQAGHIIGLMRLTGFQFTSRQQVISDAPEQLGWWGGPYGYEIASAEALRQPVPCPGGFHRGWWAVPEDVAARVLEQLPSWTALLQERRREFATRIAPVVS